jgi:hypothetical protein
MPPCVLLESEEDDEEELDDDDELDDEELDDDELVLESEDSTGWKFVVESREVPSE